MELWNKYRAVRKGVGNFIPHAFSIAKRCALRYGPKASPYFHRLVFLLLCFYSCASSASTLDLWIDDLHFDIDLAITYEQKVAGLSKVSDLPVNYGMLFDFGEAKINCFYMANTFVPLTAIFLDEYLRVVDMQMMEPETTNFHCSHSRYGLEVSSNSVVNRSDLVGSTAMLFKDGLAVRRIGP